MSVHCRRPTLPCVPLGMVQCHAGANDLSSNGLLVLGCMSNYVISERWRTIHIHSALKPVDNGVHIFGPPHMAFGILAQSRDPTRLIWADLPSVALQFAEHESAAWMHQDEINEACVTRDRCHPTAFGVHRSSVLNEPTVVVGDRNHLLLEVLLKH